MKYWGEKPYHSLDYELKSQFHKKIYKLALDGHMTCPNRDGSIGHRGCIFCSEGGSGEFAASDMDISVQLAVAKALVYEKNRSHPTDYIAYFQSYTNTYAPLPYLKKIFEEAIKDPDVRILSIATRPDCLPDETVALLSAINHVKPVWVELGLQTIHPNTAAFIRRGYDLSCFEEALGRLKSAGLTVIVHTILYLPGENPSMMLSTMDYLSSLGMVDGIKLQLLQILKGTDLADLHACSPFPLPSLPEYADMVIDCLEHLSEHIVIHRMTGDGPRSLLLAPLWSLDKRNVLNTIAKRFKERQTWQGRLTDRLHSPLQ